MTIHCRVCDATWKANPKGQEQITCTCPKNTGVDWDVRRTDGSAE